MSTKRSSSSKKASSSKSKTSSKSALAQEGAASVVALSEFSYLTTSMRLSVPPLFAGNQTQGCEELLDSMVMRYIPSLQGVLLSHSNLRFSSENAKILNDCPFAISDVTFDAIVWAPQIGQKLVGTHSLSSPSHISLLIHQTFNVSIPLPHIPSDDYYFDASLADSPPPSPSPSPEPEEEPKAEDGDEDMEKEEKPKKEVKKAEKPVVEFSTGRWRSSVTGAILGEEGEGIEFTVIGITVASQMLSLSGSLSSTPFSIPLPTSPINITSTSHEATSPSTKKASTKSKVAARISTPSPSPEPEVIADDEEVAAEEEALPGPEAAAGKEGEEGEMSVHRAERKKAKKGEKEVKKEKKRKATAVEGDEAAGGEKKAKKARKVKD